MLAPPSERFGSGFDAWISVGLLVNLARLARGHPFTFASLSCACFFCLFFTRGCVWLVLPDWQANHPAYPRCFDTLVGSQQWSFWLFLFRFVKLLPWLTFLVHKSPLWDLVFKRRLLKWGYETLAKCGGHPRRAFYWDCRTDF